MPDVPEEHQQNGMTTQSPTHESSENHAQVASYPAKKQRRPSVDRDAQDMVIDSLRSQIQDLISQVSQLNNKLVRSYDRVSDLEDDLHVASANVRTSSLKISQLELERTQHLAALNTGLLVEKTHVTAELTRLMEKATEEAAQRGQAESARLAIEKDLDDLSASLFGQANSMVAEARYDKHLSERKVEDAERALKSAEEAVQLMQAQMQSMQAEKEEAEQKTREMEVVMGKGKWIDRQNGERTISLRLLSTHSPYQDYLAFIAHLRILHPSSPNTPAMSTLLQLPFLSRLMTEDSEPTVRLDIAPSLNWLSRRSVLAAIHSGQLTIEPMSTATLFAETTVHPASTTIAGINSSNDNVACALCGVPIFPTSDSHNSSRPPIHPQSHIYQPQPTSWSGAFFKKANGTHTAPSSPTTPSFRNGFGSQSNSQIFIFRLAAPSTSIASLPIPTLAKTSSQPNSSPIPGSYASLSSNSIISQSHSQSGSQGGQPTTIYPLCMSGWCLHRLRTTCTLWAFVRTGIVDKIWEEELPPPPPPPPPSTHPEKGANGDKPPIPPRKRGLWGIASAFGERAASWGEGDRDKSKRNSGSASNTPAQPELRRLPPPLPPPSAARPSPIPPPLPKRNEGRVRTPVPDAPPPTPPRTSVEKPSEDAHAESSNTEAAAAAATTSSPRASADLPPIPPRRSREAPPPPHPEPSSDAAVPATPPPRPPRAHTPVSVPLPDSRPASPAVPSRTASPANVAAATAGGPPPPLPRRAAARTRTHLDESMSATPVDADVAEGAVSASASEPAAVAAEKNAADAEHTATEEVKEGEKAIHEAVAEGGDESATADVKGATSDADLPAESSAVTEGAAVSKEEETVASVDSELEKKTDESASVPDRSTQPSPASDVFVDAPTPGDEAADPLEKATPVEKQDKELSDGDKEVAVGPVNGIEMRQDEDEDDKQTIIDSPATVVHSSLPADETDSAEVAEPAILASANDEKVIEGEATDAQEKGDTNNDVPQVPTLAIPEKTPEEKLEEERRRREKEEWEKANYVGHATWEERTWREIVRLREDMFWARVGGIRE